MIDLTRMIALTGTPVIESELVARGSGVYSAEFGVVLHPLDRIALFTPDLIERLEATIAWRVRKANARFNALMKKLREGDDDNE